jgi:hypothetical protein
LLRNLKVVALVEWDAENLGIRSKEWYSKWVGKKGTQEVTRWLRGSMLRSLMCIRSGWEKAMQEGNKRPAVRSIGVYGTWDILEAQK